MILLTIFVTVRPGRVTGIEESIYSSSLDRDESSLASSFLKSRLLKVFVVCC